MLHAGWEISRAIILNSQFISRWNYGILYPIDDPFSIVLNSTKLQHENVLDGITLYSSLYFGFNIIINNGDGL